MIHFEIPKNQSSIIKVIGIGGGGSNAVNYMYSLGLEGVDFVVCNTDSQALTLSPVPNKVQLGPHLTSGLGAGANPEIGKQSCEESFEDIAKILKVNTRMAFITAGMGGGTGTGGAPVIAKICRDLGILTVGIVTTPFTYEGRRRMKQAQEGIEAMRQHVDTVLIISNDKLRQQFGNLPFTQAFSKADDILATAAKCITDVITTTGQINVDFADVCTVMKNGGVAILGSASVAGENRALHAVEMALNSPLLNDSDIRGAKWLLLNITSASGPHEHTMDEAEEIQAYVQGQAGDNCDVILGMGHDPNLGDKIAVTVIATGFNYKEINVDMPSRNKEPEKIMFTMEHTKAPVGGINDIRLDVKVDAPKPVDLSPTLIEMPEQPAYQVYMKDNFDVYQQKQPEPAQPEQVQEQSPVYIYEEKPAEEIPMKLVIKKEENIHDEVIKIGDRILTADEIEEKRRFEEQKKALEDRAERLRNMSFKIKTLESNDDVESVPAYQRKKVQLDSKPGSGSSHYSGYTVGPNDKADGSKPGLHTINTYLEGKKPD